MKETVLILDNIRSTHNVGSIFRTADAAGISKIYLVGTTPCPLDRFGRERSDIAKTALGAEENIPWEYRESTKDLLGELKDFYKIALEQSEKSKDYKEIFPKDKNAIILGAEVTGISDGVLSLCDDIAEIKMMGDKESLNVSVSTGIFLFRFLNI